MHETYFVLHGSEKGWFLWNHFLQSTAKRNYGMMACQWIEKEKEHKRSVGKTLTKLESEIRSTFKEMFMTLAGRYHA